ncbi:hypothetical protein K6978_19600 [Xanthomonas cucurbitae]|uniref:Tetratricopeptide repeat protein n=2 Tax=Xanthomonas cucurbitae TaxID=56453 RepID=A0ABY7YIV0_9XANT|nr:hypothetical protein K6981_19635 [Xanthomonas cucurbitae]WDM73764.1 hypothetical protein K6978_19600 [Xanthomonas cucurbitae]
MLEANDAQSLAMLSVLLKQAPDCAEAYYLLGAQQAQLGEMNLAEQAFEQALRLSPGLEMARFQLGQLLLVTGRNAEAAQMLAPLAESADAIGSYASGLVSIANQQIDLAISQLQMGLAQVQPLAALQADMRALVHTLSNNGVAQGFGPTDIGDSLPGASMLLSNYSRYN